MTSTDDSYLFPSPPATASVMASSPQGDNGKDDLLRRRMEFLGLKPEDSEEYKKVREGNTFIITN